MTRLIRIVLVALLLMGCSGGSATEVSVSAASSLTDAYGDIEAAFEAAHPDIDVVLNLAGSATLREQILEGAPVDVFAPADLETMTEVEAFGAVAGEPQIFARNLLQIAVPSGNPAGVTTLDDFARDDLFLGLCAVGVPCGDLARQALRTAGVIPSLDTNEANVRALLLKVEEGELDAGITYVTDVVAARGAVDGIDIPIEHNVLAEYPIAVLDDAAHPDAAASLVAFVLSDDGREILADHGFALP